MDSALVATVLLGAGCTAVVLLVIWVWSRADVEREAETQLVAGHELHKWADRQGWRMCEALPRDLTDPWVHERAPGEELVRATEGRHAGHRAVIALYARHDDDGVHRTLACLVELPAAQPAVRVRHRVGPSLRPRNPALPEPARDPEFDRALKVESYSDVDLGQTFTAPVRAALLQLSPAGPSGAELVRMNGRILRVVFAGWPPAVDLTRLLDGVADLVVALPGDSPTR